MLDMDKILLSSFGIFCRLFWYGIIMCVGISCMVLNDETSGEEPIEPIYLPYNPLSNLTFTGQADANLCRGSLGVATPGLFPRFWMSASDGNAFQGRLQFTAAWNSKKALKTTEMAMNEEYAWIQVDLQFNTLVTGIKTQGDPRWKNWVTAFTIQFSKSCKHFEAMLDKEGNEMIFPGNSDKDTEVYNIFPDVVFARCIRVVPSKVRSNVASLRFELTGCEEKMCRQQVITDMNSKYFPLSTEKLMKKPKTGLAARRRAQRRRPISRNKRTHSLLRYRRDAGIKFAEFSFETETILFGLIIKGYTKNSLKGYFTVEYSRNCHRFNEVKEKGRFNTPVRRFRFENKKQLDVTWHHFPRPIRVQCVKIMAFIFQNVRPSFSAKVNFIGCGTKRGIKRQCGKQKHSRRMKRVIGGQSSELGHWPWLVSVQLGNDYGGYQHVCGGTLIDDSHVLTAAHCIYTMYASAFYGRNDVNNSARWNDRTFKKYLRVSVGEHSFESDEGTSTFLTVKDVYTHPQYNISCYKNDVAVVTLGRPVHFTDHVNTVCLPYDKYNTKKLIAASANCTVVGWGQITSGEFPQVPHAVDVPLISNTKCDQMYSHLKLTQDMFCAGPEDGKRDACVGDSGGPLMCEVEDQWVQVGIVSWNIGCAVEGFPGVYVNLEMFLDWINSKID